VVSQACLLAHFALSAHVAPQACFLSLHLTSLHCFSQSHFVQSQHELQKKRAFTANATTINTSAQMIMFVFFMIVGGFVG
jgi:hypothetical protein